jgi:SAM-dependent methyltransferase
MSFICNITGNYYFIKDNEKNRDGILKLGFNSRLRAICYIFCKIFYGKCKIMNNLKKNKKLIGIGMSDIELEKIFKKKFNYTNTFYHRSPYLDIYNDEHVKKYFDLDFIISSDVFEHINPLPSLQVAFDNLFKMLKPGGCLIFSVPYTYGEHKEHYPNLYNYKIEYNNGEYILHNVTIDNKTEIFKNLCFHGGPGNVLEMRIFSKKSLTLFIESAGFIDIIFHEINGDMNKYGIFWDKDNTNNCSLIITAKKPV